jgi:hypothetical protein
LNGQYKSLASSYFWTTSPTLRMFEFAFSLHQSSQNSSAMNAVGGSIWSCPPDSGRMLSRVTAPPTVGFSCRRLPASKKVLKWVLTVLCAVSVPKRAYMHHYRGIDCRPASSIRHHSSRRFTLALLWASVWPSLWQHRETPSLGCQFFSFSSDRITTVIQTLPRCV